MSPSGQRWAADGAGSQSGAEPKEIEVTPPDLIWANLLVLGLAYELFTVVDREDGNILSERVRAWFRVHTRPGRTAFGIAWTGFAVWFLVHFLT